jgi:hypothetical protein
MITPIWRRRLTCLLGLAVVYVAGTLGLARVIGVYFSPVRCVLFGAVMLAGWRAARGVSRRVLRTAGRRQR